MYLQMVIPKGMKKARLLKNYVHPSSCRPVGWTLTGLSPQGEESQEAGVLPAATHSLRTKLPQSNHCAATTKKPASVSAPETESPPSSLRRKAKIKLKDREGERVHPVRNPDSAKEMNRPGQQSRDPSRSRGLF